MSRRDRRGWRDRLHVHWPKNDKSQDDGSDRSSFMSSPSTMRNRVLPVRQSDSQTKDVAGGSGEKHEIDAEELTKEHNTLWNEAYDAIRSDKEKAKYLDLYEKIVARRFLDDENDGVHRDRDEREKQMKEMVKLGLERVQKAKRFTEKYESVFDFTKPFKAILDIPLKSIPQTALPWAVISSTLDPGRTNATLYGGVSYTVSRIDWYSQLTDTILSDNVARDKLLRTARSRLREEILELYQSLLFYQIKSVCFYHKNQVGVFMRAFVDLDRWSDDLEEIRKAEEALQRDIAQYDLESLKSQVAESRSYMEEQFNQILDALKETSNAQRSIEQEKQDSECIKLLCGTDPRSDIDGIQSRKDDLIRESYKWILDIDEYRKFIDWEDPDASLLWITGQAGTGKTMLLIGIIKELGLQGRLELDCPELLFFFCQDGDKESNNSVAVLRGIIWLLIIQQPELMEYPREIYRQSAGKHLTDGNVFITLRNMLRAMLNDQRLGRVFLIIDALDECSDASRKEMTHFIYQEASAESRNRRVRWLVSSRPLPDIHRVIRPSSGVVARIDVNEYILQEPIHAYIDRKISELKSRTVDESRLDHISHQLKRKASNTFIWVSLVIRELKDTDIYRWTKVLEQLPRDLGDLYKKLLGQLAKSDAKDECQRVLVAVMLACRPLNLAELEILSVLEPETALDIVRQCRSFLTVDGKTVYVLHESAQDYLKCHFRKLRDVSMETLHGDICLNSLQGLTALKRDIYNLSDPGIEIHHVCPPDPSPLYPFSYACQYWVFHLSHSNLDAVSPGMIQAFLTVHLLHWLEAMSLLKRLPETIDMMRVLEELLQNQGFPELREFIWDAQRFIRKNLSVISIAPLQAYISALVFAPTKSIVRCNFWDTEKPVWMHRFPEVPEHWNALLQILENSYSTHSLLFSPDGRFIAASGDSNLTIWDAFTGVVLQTFETSSNETLSFSPDSTLFAVGSPNGTMILRDTNEWEVRQTLRSPGNLIHGVFAPSNQLLLTASRDGLISIWDTCEWKLRRSIEGPERISYGAFSPDGKLIALVLTEIPGQLDIWNIETGTLEESLDAHIDDILCVAFPTNNSMWTVGTVSVKMWDMKTRECDLRISFDPDTPVEIATISSDCQKLATARAGITFLWELETGRFQGALQAEFTEHMAFSPDSQILATGTSAGYVELWDTSSLSFPIRISGTGLPVYRLSLSPNRQWAASCEYYDGPTLWNARTGKQAHNRSNEYEHHTVRIAFSPNSQVMATASCDNIVRLWSAERGDVLQAFEVADGQSICELVFAEHLLHVTWKNGRAETFNINAGIETDLAGLSDSELQIMILDNWVVDLNAQRRLIWFPPDCSPSDPSVWDSGGGRVMVGTHDGSVIFMDFETGDRDVESAECVHLA